MCQIVLLMTAFREEAGPAKDQALVLRRTRQGVITSRLSLIHTLGHILWPADQNKARAMRPFRRRNILSWQIWISSLRISSLWGIPSAYRLLALVVVRRPVAITDVEFATIDSAPMSFLEDAWQMYSVY